MAESWEIVATALAEAMERSSADVGSGFCNLTEREHAALGMYHRYRQVGRNQVRSLMGFGARLDALRRHVHQERG